MTILNDDGFRQLIVDVVSAILDGHGTTATPPGYHSNRLAAVAAKGKQECVQFLIVGLDGANDVFNSLLGLCQCHSNHPILISHS